jgi:MYXO-CTERM domain-containing protein
MVCKNWLTVPIVVVSLVLTFAPVFSQDTGNTAPGMTDDNATTTRIDTDDDGPNFGWLGLLGLVGLGGLMRRDKNDRHDHSAHDRNVNR